MLVALPPARARAIAVVIRRRIRRILLMMMVTRMPATTPSRICGCAITKSTKVLIRAPVVFHVAAVRYRVFSLFSPFAENFA